MQKRNMKQILTGLTLSVTISGCVSTGPGGQTGIHAETAALVAGTALATAVMMNAANTETQVVTYPSYPERFDRPVHAGRGGQIETGRRGLCLDISRQVVNGAPLQTWNCNGRVNQRFRRVGEEIRIDGKCLDVAGLNQQDGARVIAYTCNGGENQRWDVSGGMIRSRMNGKCLDVSGERFEQGTPVIMWRCHGSRNQRFSWQ